MVLLNSFLVLLLLYLKKAVYLVAETFKPAPKKLLEKGGLKRLPENLFASYDILNQL